MSSHGSAIAFCSIFAALFCITLAEVAPFRQCPYPEGHVSLCTIHELRIDPCKEGVEGKPCRVKRGRNSSISIDYTANFEGDTMETSVYWVNQVAELPFVGVETNTCLSTPCPVVSGKKQTYNLELFIAKSYPLRSYDVKWQFHNTQGQECCLILQIKIHK